MGDILWCCHVRGPDDLYAAPDYATALRWSDAMNALNWCAGKHGTPTSYDDCLVKAAPAIWPYGAKSHAENIPASVACFAAPAEAG